MAATTGVASEAAVFVDYENVLLHFRERYHNPPHLHHFCYEMVRALLAHLKHSHQLGVSRAWAFADFERLPAGGLHLLARNGVEAIYVRGGAEHKNAADLRLCVEAMATCHTAPAVSTFVLMSGDGDYMPLVQYLRRQGRRVILVSFPENTATEFYHYFSYDDGTLLNGYTLLSNELRAELHTHRAEYLLRHPEAETNGAKRPAEVRSNGNGYNGHGSKADGQRFESVPEAARPAPVPVEPPTAPIVKPLYTPAPSNWTPTTPLPKWPEAVKPPSLGGTKRPAVEGAPTSRMFEPPRRLTDEDAGNGLKAVVLFTPKGMRKSLRMLRSHLQSACPQIVPNAGACATLLATLRQHGALTLEEADGEEVYVLNPHHPDVRRYLQPHQMA